MLHRLRQEAVKRRTALVNQMRGLLSERGIVIGQGVTKVRKRLPELLEDAENSLNALSRVAFAEQYERLLVLDKQIKQYDRNMSQLRQTNELIQRLSEVPGVGPMLATIVVADLGEGWHYSASLGIVPWQSCSGGKPVLLGISKRSNRYIRILLIHGARAVLRTYQY